MLASLYDVDAKVRDVTNTTGSSFLANDIRACHRPETRKDPWPRTLGTHLDWALLTFGIGTPTRSVGSPFSHAATTGDWIFLGGQEEGTMPRTT